MYSTSENNKRIAKNTLLLYFRMLFTMGISLYTSRAILKVLGVEDFGIYNVVGGVVAMFSFINSAMSSSTQRFLTFELGKGRNLQLQKIFSISLSIHGIISVIVLILAETVGLWFLYNKMIIPDYRLNAALWIYQCSVITTVIMIMSVPYNAIIIAHEKMNAFAYISILEVSLKLLIVYLLVVFDYDKLKQYAVLMLMVQLLIRIVYGSYCKRHFKEAKFKLILDKRLFREMAQFAGWTMNGNLAVIGYTQGLNLLLNIFFGPTVNAARGIAVQVQGAILSFSRNFQTALNPQITKSYSMEDFEYMHKLIYASSRYSFFMLLFLSLPIILETRFILSLWLDTVPDYSISFIRIILIISMLTALSTPMVISIHSTGKLKRFQLWEGSFLLSIVPISYVFLKFGFQPEVVFIVHLCVEIIAQYIRVRITCPLIYMSLRLYYKNVIVNIVNVLLLSLIFPILLYFYLPYGLFSTIIVCAVSAVSVAFFTYLFLDKGERKIIKNKIILSRKV